MTESATDEVETAALLAKLRESEERPGQTILRALRWLDRSVVCPKCETILVDPKTKQLHEDAEFLRSL